MNPADGIPRIELHCHLDQVLARVDPDHATMGVVGLQLMPVYLCRLAMELLPQ